MEKPSFGNESTENPKRIHLTFMRHAEQAGYSEQDLKVNDNPVLSLKGEDQAKEAFGKHHPTLPNKFAVRTSGLDRAVRTGGEIVNSAKQNDDLIVFKQRKRNELGSPDESLYSKEVAKEVGVLLKEKGDEAALAWFMGHDPEQRIDSETKSIYEIGSRIAKSIKKHIKLLERMQDDDLNIDLVSHGGLLEPALYTLIGDQVEDDPINPEGKSFLEKMGGKLTHTEGFHIDIEQNGKDISVKISLRGHEYSIPVEKIYSIIQKAEEIEGSYNLNR